jgi:hypothetical protein
MRDITASYVEILNLVHRYPELIDGGDFAGIGELFRDATIMMEVPGGKTMVEVKGADAVRRMYEATTRLYPDDGTPHTRHVISNEIVEIDEQAGTAVCRYYITVFQRTDAFPLAPVWANRYEDRLRRKGGHWRMDFRRGYAHLPGDTSHHLLPNPIG